MKTREILLFFCCILFSNETPVLSNAQFDSRTDEEAIMGNNHLDNHPLRLGETHLHQRLGKRSEFVRPGEFPYMVSVQINGRHFCGGGLLSSKHVLTAGHCVYDYVKNLHMNKTEVTVEVGSASIGSGRSYKVKRLACTKNSVFRLSDTVWPDDIAMITLQDDVILNKNVKFIRLPPASFELPVGTKVVVTGYGAFRRKDPTSRGMRKTELYITSIQKCDDFYDRRITYRQICTVRDPGYGTCEGDSGSPLMYNSQIVGVVSGGGPHCSVGNPDVFVNVSYFLPFIKYEMGLGNTYGLD